MAYIEKIRLKGFKSFAKPLELEFGTGFNVFIGPNGSGKTNIVDAMTFVLGKISAKSMRAEKSSNLIFNGGKKGSPMREAEVSIYFSNKDKEFPFSTETVKVTRVVKQSGNSIYLVNDNKYTRQQVVDILSKARIDPDGHNIVLQGDIVTFATMKPDERRIIIEDISGISVYEDKKQKALLELDKVEKKLNDANLILKEREVHLRELKKERDQAIKFREAEEKLKENKATYVYLQIKEKENKRDEVDEQIKKRKLNLDEINKKTSELKEKINKKKGELEGINKDIEQKGDIEQSSLQKDLENLKEEIIKKTTRSENLNNEIKKIGQRTEQLEKDKQEVQKRIQFLNEQGKSYEKELVQLRNEDRKLQQQIEQFKKNYNLSDFSSLEKIEKEIESVQNDIFNLKEEKNKLNNGKEKLKLELEQINKIFEEQTSPENKKKLQDLKFISNHIDDLINKLNVSSSQIELYQNNRDKKRLELADLEATRIRVTESLLGNKAVNTIINSKIKGVYGTIASLGKVEDKYSMALEVVAGARINSIIVDNDLTAADCINLLKEKKIGTAMFLPLNKLKVRENIRELEQLKNFSGVKDIASNLIKYDKKYEKAFEYVFGSTLVVEDLNIARKIGIGRVRMVTLDGSLVEPSGAMIGGFRKKLVGLFEGKDLDIKIDNAKNEIERLKEEISKLNNLRNEYGKKLDELKEKKSALMAEIARFNYGGYNFDELRNNKNRLRKEISEYESKIKDLDKEINKNISILDKLRLNRKGSRPDEKVQSKLSDLEEKNSKIKERIIQINTETKNLQEQIKTTYLPELGKIQEIIKQHNKEVEDFGLELNKLENELKEQRPLLNEKEKKEKKFREEYKGLFLKRNKVSEDIRDFEAKVSQEEFKIREIENKINEVSLVRAKVVAEVEALQLEFEPYIGVKLRKNISKDDLKLGIQEAEKIVKNFGNINMKALEIYDVIEKEYGELVNKKDLLNKEKEDVLNMMSEIEGKKKRIFMRTYKEISENFKRIFLSLSAKGEAYLDLEDKENPLNEGLDIKVRLAGTKFLDLNSLSGGEKTLSALAFIFAIQEYEPMSFYLLDEVDAALDKTNSQLLSNLISKYAKNSQYIMVSHNDSVITEADQIYGVSMQLNGISKVISLKI